VPARAEVFLTQARAGAGRSPLYDELWRRLADEPLGDALVDGDYRWDTPLKVVGGLHYLVLAGRASWDDVGRALVEEREFLRRYVAEQGVQTNEVQRSWMLLPCFLEAARRLGAASLDVVEIGPSAGLNLVWDRYGYRYENGAWGDPASPIVLSGEERTPVPAELLELAPRVRSRVGIDLAPIDAASAEGRLLLRSFVWPDMTDRLERLDRAMELLSADPPPIVEGDVAERLPELLVGDGPLLVFETIALVYVPKEGRRRVDDALAEAGTRRPLAVVRTPPHEQAHSTLELEVRPDGRRDVVARADFHGAWIDWLA
jgi:hypothetical protein